MPGIMRYQSGMSVAGGGFNPYGAGAKRYGSGRRAPNIGNTGDPLGYAKRDREAVARRNLALRRMKQQQSRKFMVM